MQVYCSSSNGNDFIGWENQSGELVSTETEFALSPEYIASIHETDFTLTAKYAASFLSGDANGDGAVNTEDAVLIMRAALELQPEISVEVCDMNSNGIIDISLPIEAKAATVDRGRISDASNACSASSRPASRRWSADVRFRRSIAATRQCRFSSRCCLYMSISFVVPRFDCVENGTWGMGGAQWKGDDFAILERHDASSGEYFL